jgi:hypothetical protein
MRSLALLGVVVCTGACSFDASGTEGMPTLADAVDETEGETPDVPSVDDAETPTDEATTTNGDGTDDGDPEDDDGDEGNDDDGSDGSDDDGTANHDDSAGETSCPADISEIVWVDDAMLEAPMSLATVTGAQGDPSLAVSTVAESGKASFTLALPCAGEYFVWGLVWDYTPGAWGDPDPDSFHVGTGGDEVVWRYGCQTFGLNDLLSWQRLERLDTQPCSSTGLALVATGPGDYTLSFRNREAGAGSMVAGISAVMISTDPNADPYALYTP